MSILLFLKQNLLNPKERVKSLSSQGWLNELLLALLILFLVALSSSLAQNMLIGRRPSFFGMSLSIFASMFLGLLIILFLVGFCHAIMNLLGRNGSVKLLFFGLITSLSPYILDCFGTSVLSGFFRPYFSLATVEILRMLWILILFIESIKIFLFVLKTVYGEMKNLHLIAIYLVLTFFGALFFTSLPIAFILTIIGGLI